MHGDVVTYEPDNVLRKGYRSLWREVFAELVDNRWLTTQLFRRNFVAAYKQSFVGIAWVFILPLVNVAVFFAMSRSGVFNLGEIRVPYPLYALLGMAFWQLFATGVTSCGSSLAAAGEMIVRINFSKKALVIAALGKPLVSFLLQMLLVGFLFFVFGIVPSAGIFLLPFVLMPLVLLTLGIGLIVALANAIVRDVGGAVSVAMPLLMYLTPVLYARPNMGILNEITRLNPMYYFISAGRDLILTGAIREVSGFVCSWVMAVGVFIFSLATFHVAETRLTERV